MYMRRRKRPLLLLIFSLISFASLSYLIMNSDPTQKLNSYGLQLTTIPFFFILVFLSTFSLSAYILNNSRRGLLIALAIVFYLLLRFYNLTHFFFLLLLVALFFVLELLFSNHKK